MTDTATADRQADRPGPTNRQMLSLWIPLAASLVMMVLEPSIINVGLSRSLDPELALAAYGVAYSLALLLEAPILMILDASVAKSADRPAFLLVRRFTLGLGLTVTGVWLLFSVTPLYHAVAQGLMRIPADVAARARPTLQLLALWPLPIAWRRAHQGVLIRTGRTTIITVATGLRLVVLSLALYGGLLVLPNEGAAVAALAMDASVIAEALLITWATGAALRSPPFAGGSAHPHLGRLTLRDLWRFYRPLLGTTVLRQAARPALSAGVAVALQARSSLAAWPVAWGLATLIGGPAWSLQQLTTAVAVDRSTYRRTWRFSVTISVALTALFALVAFTPLYGAVMGGVYNLTAELQSVARTGTRIMALFPLVSGAQSVYRGALIRAGQTRAVRTAMMINLAVLAASLVVGVALRTVTGVTLAAIGTMLSNVVEQVWLQRETQLTPSLRSRPPYDQG